MKYLFLFCAVLLFQPLSMAVEISVAGTRIVIPSPNGYSLVTEDMQPYANIVKRFVPSTNEQFALFIPASDIALAARGGIPECEKWLAVQGSKAMLRRSASASEFSQVKRLIRTENEKIFKMASAKLPGFVQEINKGITDDFNVDIKLNIGKMVPLPAHAETSQTLAFSTLVNISTADENGKQEDSQGAVTTTLVHVKGKVLYLYANGDKSQLPWTRAASQRWTNAIVTANRPSDDSQNQSADQASSGFDWGSFVRRAPKE